MNLFAFAQRGSAKSAYAGTYGPTGTPALGSRYATIDQKDAAPTPQESVQNLVGVAYACANLNANAVASNPLRLFVRTAKGQKRTRWGTEPVGTKTLKWLRDTRQLSGGFTKAGGTVEEVKDHALLDVLGIGDGSGAEDEGDDGQPRLLGHHLFWATQVYLETIGRAYWLVERDGLGAPSKVWLLRSHMVREWLSSDTSGGKIIDYYEYLGGVGARYDPRDVIRFANPDPHTLYIGGLAPMRAAIEKIRLLRRDDAMLNAILQNMGFPGAILSPKADDSGGGLIGPDVARRVRVEWDRALKQAGAGGTVTLPQAFDVHFAQWKPAEIIPLDKARAVKNDVCNCFDVPDALLERNAANLASAKTADFSHAKYAVKPRCSNIESTLKRLVRMYDDSGRLFLAYDNPVPEDEVFGLEQMKAASFAVTIDELRESMDLEPYGTDAGKLRYLPKGMVAIGRDGLPVEPAAAVAGKPDAKPPRDRVAGKMVTKSGGDSAEGVWRTINGVHVFIGADGTIERGPKGFIGKKPHELSGGHKPKDDAGSSRTKEEKQSPRTKSEIAKQSATYVGKEVQRYAEEKNEPEFAKGIGGLSYDDNEPVDVVAGEGGVVRHGFELKTLVLNKASKLTMDRYSQVRKVEWERDKGATYHTVCIDDRKVFNANGGGNHDKGNRIYYYRRGIAGSARIETMHPCRSLKEVRQLIAADEADLPKGARRTDGEIHQGKWKFFTDAKGRGYKNSKSGEIVRPKK